jgi:menaquinone-dependent protoporphyrinogen IX oxidase
MANINMKELNAKLSSIETALKGLNVNCINNNDKKPRNCTDTGLLHKAKLLHYQDVKNSEEVMKIVQSKHDTVNKVDFKNWRSVKEVTDEMFGKLSSANKQAYLDKARDAKNVV